MKLKNKNLLALLAAGLSLSVISCEKEETIKDTEVPTVSLAHSGKADDLFGEINISATAQDNERIERIEFFINGNSLGQATKEPFEITWNTQETTDGQHTLKAVAYDASNNKNEATSDITIKNTLFKASIADGYMESYKKRFNFDHYDIWLFLTDENGNTIGEAQQLSDGKELKWNRTAAFPAGIIYLNRMEHYNSTRQDGHQNKQYSISTYPNFHLAEAKVGVNLEFRNPAGNVDITIHNDFDGSDTYEYRTNFPGKSKINFGSQNSVNYKAELNYESEFGLTTYSSMSITDENRLKYYRWDEFKSAGTYSFHTNDFALMDAHTVSFPEELTMFFVASTGYEKAERKEGIELDGVYLTGVMPASYSTSVYYVDKLFPYVRTFIMGDFANKYFTRLMNSKAPANTELPTFSLEVVKHTNENLEVKPVGEFDGGTVSLGYSSYSEIESVTVRKYIYTGNSAGQFALPQIPENLLALYPQFDIAHDFKLNYTNATDYVGSLSYEQQLENLFTSSYNGPATNEYTSLTAYPQNEGGRIHKAPADSKARIEEEIMKARGFFPY